MSSSTPTSAALAFDGRNAEIRPARRGWGKGIHGADNIWAVAFALPYVAIFFFFVIYPICYGLYLGSNPALYRELFTDPRYLNTVLNTLLYVIIGVNLKMVVAFALSGYFMNKGWWIKGLLVIFILPWATPALPAYMSIHWFLNGQWGMLNSALDLFFGIEGPVYLNDYATALGANIGAYIWKTLPFWTVILLAGRMAVPQELYEAADVDGASSVSKFWHVTVPLMANLYLVCTLLDMVFALGDFNSTYFVSGGGPAMSTEVLATLGIRYAFTLAQPQLGVATVMSALPVLVPLVIMLMRKLRMSEGQL
jgi:multiple sugar transport system permease protein